MAWRDVVGREGRRQEISDGPEWNVDKCGGGGGTRQGKEMEAGGILVWCGVMLKGRKRQ